jgi:L-ascorbate metabolism protein UlaG (beta-lactamase superfamily)
MHFVRRGRGVFPNPWRRRLGAAAVVMSGVVAVTGWWVGWWSRERPWNEAIGLDEVAVEERPASGPSWPGADSAVPPPELIWLGHSGFLVRWGGRAFLLDPNTSAWCAIARRRVWPTPDLSALGPIDAVLISHAHLDHLDQPTLVALDRVGVVVAPAGSERWVPDGMPTLPMRAGDLATFGRVEVHAVEAAHNGDRRHPFRSEVRALGYVLRMGDEAVYFAGDTGLANDFASIARRFHPRVAILPIGAWAPPVPLRAYHLSPDDAVEAALRLGRPLVVPCHFGTFTLALDRPDRALPRFAAAARARGVRWMLPPLLGAAGAPAPDPSAGALLTEAAP